MRMPCEVFVNEAAGGKMDSPDETPRSGKLHGQEGYHATIESAMAMGNTDGMYSSQSIPDPCLRWQRRRDTLTNYLGGYKH